MPQNSFSGLQNCSAW